MLFCCSPPAPSTAEATASLVSDSLPVSEIEPVRVVDWQSYGIQIAPTDQAYAEVLADIRTKKEALRLAWQSDQVSLDSVGKVFTACLVNDIMPYWYGTPWDFEGHTDIPNEGQIACGYLVSTTLKHLGLNLNRYKLAQQAALNEAKTLALGADIVSMIRMPLARVIEQIKSDFQEGLYLVGLDYHVGLILYQNGEVFFIHSSLYEPVSVVIELAETAAALLYNDDYYFAPISNNPALMKAWLQNTALKIVSQ